MVWPLFIFRFSTVSIIKTITGKKQLQGWFPTPESHKTIYPELVPEPELVPVPQAPFQEPEPEQVLAPVPVLVPQPFCSLR